MSTAIPFDSIVVGEELAPFTLPVTEAAIEQYRHDWDDPNPLYGEVMPPAYMAGLACFRLLSSRYDAAATIGAKTEHHNHRPVLIGETLRVEGRIVEKYIKRALEYVVVESEAYDGENRLVRTSRDHILLSLERTPVVAEPTG